MLGIGRNAGLWRTLRELSAALAARISNEVNVARRITEFRLRLLNFWLIVTATLKRTLEDNTKLGAKATLSKCVGATAEWTSRFGIDTEAKGIRCGE